jgi:sec-independent protein translocase protein TatA
MIGRLGPLELGIILVIVLLIFGVGRVSKIAEELGKGIKAFRKGIQIDSEKSDQDLTDCK